MSRKGCRNFSAEEKQWVIDHFDEYDSLVELRKDFIKTFNLRPASGIKSLCLRLNLHKANTGRYGQRDKEQLPVGTERICQGIIYVKVKNVPSGSKGSIITCRKPPYWLPKHRKVWEDHYGKVPDGFMVVFLDQDKRNFDINNLCCIKRSIVGVMNKNKWFTSNPTNTLTAIRYCELMEALQGRAT